MRKKPLHIYARRRFLRARVQNDEFRREARAQAHACMQRRPDGPRAASAMLLPWRGRTKKASHVVLLIGRCNLFANRACPSLQAAPGARTLSKSSAVNADTYHTYGSPPLGSRATIAPPNASPLGGARGRMHTPRVPGRVPMKRTGRALARVRRWSAQSACLAKESARARMR